MAKKKTLRVGLKYKSKRIFLKVRKCGYFYEAFGLMFQKKENSNALLFDFVGRKRLALHSLFVFFPFLALWLDDKNKIVEIKEIKPFSFNVFSKKPFSKIVEIPLNKKYIKIIRKLDGRERFK
jgi:uncharacterized membrane protein (UPF0127 family)